MKNTFVTPIKEDGSFGKTEYVYFNGANTDDFDYPDDEYTNVKDYYTHMTGQLYFSKEYDEKNRVVKLSKNWLKAMDTLGFMICQTKICESKYHGLYDDKFEEENNSYALTKTSIIEYEDKFNLKRKVIKSGLNGNGEEIKISTEIRYLWEENEQLLSKNSLSDISMTIKKEETSGKILEVNKYEYAFDSNNAYYKNKEFIWNGTGDYIKDESNWICKNEITKVNSNYDKISEKDMEGISTAYIYDKDNKFITAKFDNAEIEEVFYCGFEPYENTQKIKMEKGNVNDYITVNEKFSGTESLLIEKNNSMSIAMTRKESSSRLSFAVKTNKEFYVSWGENKLSYTSTEGKWQRIDQILSNSESKKGIFTVSFYGIDDIYLDALFISPLLSQGESYVYGTDFMIQTASHKNYGRGIKMFYDKYKNPVATAGDDGIFIGYSRKCYGKNNQNCELDETLSIEMPKGGYLQWYENGFKNTDLWTLNDNEWTFEKNRNFILFFAKNLGNQNIICEKLKIEILCTQLTITYDGKIVLKNEKKDGNHYLFIKIGNRIQFSCEDKILYSGIHEFSEESKCTLEVEKTSDTICIGYCKDPKISISYSDYSGNVHQDMGITENGIIVGQTILNELGQAEITTKKAYFEMELWKYRTNLVTSYNWDTGILEGEVADKYPEDNGFSYSQIKSSLAPTPEPREVGQAGKNHAIKGFGNIININKYINEKEFYGLDEKSYLLKVQKTPDNIINIDAIDSFDNKIMSLCKNSYDEENIKIIKYKYDYNGKLTNVYYPNYFTNVSEKEKYESQYQYDGLGRITMQKEPDGGIVRFIYDKTGKIRFKKNGEDSNYYIYYVYDNYTRKIEEGRVEEDWNEDQLKKEALIVGNAPKNSIPKIKYHYDGDEKNIYDIRKLHLIENFNNDGILESYEKYDYDYEGRIIKKNIGFGNHEDIVIMKYDNQGNVIQYSFGDESEDAINYIYDIQSRMVGVSYKGDEIYSCSYLPEGNVAEEKFMPKSSNELCRRYSYNSSMWLKKLEDEYFVQELEYDETSSKSNSGGRITKCKSTFLKNIPENIKTEISYKYSYDSYGRLMEYDKDGMIYEIKFDANGNQVGDNSEENEFSYEFGTNKLTTYKEKYFSYDNVGNINSIASTKNEKLFLDYDKVLNKVSTISNENRKNSYFYGTQGNIAYTSNDETTYINYDEKDRLLTETRSGQKVICLYGANGMMGQIKDGKVYYFIKDYQSSVREIYDGENILAVFNYNPFGNFEDNIIIDSIVNELIPIRFTSARYEEKIGLYRMKYRLYDPVTGRFINIDPENQHTSSYIYGYADWVNYFDPDGAISLGSILSIAVGVVIIGVGAAIAIGTAGMGTGAGFALGLLGAGLIGAGIGFTTYGITSAINNDFNIGDCLIYGGVGFVSGVVGAGIGAGITAITPVIGATASGLVDIGAGIVVGGTDALISNGFININHSRDFFYNWEQTVTIGCIVGGLAAGFSGMCSSLRNNRAFIGRNADNTIGVENFDIGRFGHLHATYKSSELGERYADFTRIPEGVSVNERVYVHNQYNGRGMGNNAMEVNTSSMGRFLRNGNRINNEYRNVPRFRETNLFGPNCTTYTIDRFAGAGINMPIWLRTPTLVNKWAAWICRFQ